MVKASRHNKDYALKIFIPDKEESEFSLECNILAELEHPRIPRFIGAFSHNGLNYLVQEFIEGYPLSYYIVNGKCFTEEEAKNVLLQLFEILDYLHQQEGARPPVIHRDLRLSNLICYSDKVYLLDFGLARRLEGKLVQPANRPEDKYAAMYDYRPGAKTYALLRNEISPSSDLFGAGVIGLDLFTNWIEDESLFRLPWREILPASDSFKTLIDGLLSPEKQFKSALCAMQYLVESTSLL